MSTLVLKGVPVDLHTRLKAQAKEHRRSLNQEAIAILARSTNTYKVPHFEPFPLEKPLTSAEVLSFIKEGRR